MKKITQVKIPVVRTLDSGKEGKRETAPTTSMEIIRGIVSLSGNALNRAIQQPDNVLLADVALELLLEEIAAIPGKTSSDGCSLARGAAKECPVTHKVATEMVKIQSATGRCLDVLEDMIANKSYDLGPIVQCLKNINKSTNSLLSSAQDFESSPGLEDSSIDQG